MKSALRKAVGVTTRLLRLVGEAVVVVSVLAFSCYYFFARFALAPHTLVLREQYHAVVPDIVPAGAKIVSFEAQFIPPQRLAYFLELSESIHVTVTYQVPSQAPETVEETYYQACTEEPIGKSPSCTLPYTLLDIHVCEQNALTPESCAFVYLRAQIISRPDITPPVPPKTRWYPGTVPGLRVHYTPPVDDRRGRSFL